jgi:hypothetical protein
MGRIGRVVLTFARPGLGDGKSAMIAQFLAWGCFLLMYSCMLFANLKYGIT